MKKFLALAEQVFTVISLFFFSGGILTLVLSGGFSQGDGQEPPDSYPLIQLVFLIIYIITFFLIIRKWKSVLTLLIKEKFILLLVGMALLSILWSDVPFLTLRRSVALTGTTLFGIYFAIRYGTKKQLQLLGWMFSIVVFLSYIFVLVFPEYGIMGGSHEGIWRGIYVHKNVLGKIISLSTVVFLVLAASARHFRFLLWCGFSFSLILLIFSTSKTALGICAVLLSVLCAIQIWQKRYNVIIPALIAIVMIGGSLFLQVTANFYPPLALSANLSVISTQSSPALQKSAAETNTQRAPVEIEPQPAPIESAESLGTLTGRTKLWPLVWEEIQKNPLLGNGYSGFWQTSYGAEEIQKKIGDWAKHSHNGLLDLWLDLGLLGVLIFLIGFTVNLFRALTQMHNGKSLVGLWSILYFVYLILANLTESTILRQNNLFWLLYVSVALTMLKKYIQPHKILE